MEVEYILQYFLRIELFALHYYVNTVQVRFNDYYAFSLVFLLYVN
jgi:hypothetical protein